MTYKVTNPRGLYKFADTLKEEWEIYLEWGNAEEFLANRNKWLKMPFT